MQKPSEKPLLGIDIDGVISIFADGAGLQPGTEPTARAGGRFEYLLIDGIPQLLEQLQADGKHMCVATSKPEVFAIRIVEHFGLSRFFGRVYGSELDGTRVDKRDLLPYVQQQEGFASHQAVMIGDRNHDVIGAKSIHVPTIGVRWGYGSDEELVAAGVHRLVDHPSEIATLVL